MLNPAYRTTPHTHTNYQRSYDRKRDQQAQPKRLQDSEKSWSLQCRAGAHPRASHFHARLNNTPPSQERHRKPTTTGDQDALLTNREAAPRELDKGRARSKPCRRSPKNHPRHNLRRASCCGLQDGVFKKSTTPECRHRPIRGSWVFTRMKKRDGDWPHGAFSKGTPSADAATVARRQRFPFGKITAIYTPQHSTRRLPRRPHGRGLGQHQSHWLACRPT